MKKWGVSLVSSAVLGFALTARAQTGAAPTPAAAPPPPAAPYSQPASPAAAPGAEPPPPAGAPPPVSAPATDQEGRPGAPPPPPGPPPPMQEATYAAPPPAYAAAAPMPAPAEDRHAYRHDGFYLRFGIGAGYGRVVGEGTLDFGSPASGISGSSDFTATYTGGGPAYELLIGGTVARGLVIGGGLVGQDISRPKVQLDSAGLTTTGQIRGDSALGVGALGPFIEWYPDETGGFHLGGMVGFAIIGLNESSGGGGSIWAGYDFWIGKQWSMGPELRGAWASGKWTPVGQTREADESGSTYELVLSFVYH